MYDTLYSLLRKSMSGSRSGIHRTFASSVFLFLTPERRCLLRQADNQMKLWQCVDNGLGCDDLQVEKAVAPLARLCPIRSLVSGMASITLVNYPFLKWVISR